MRYTIALVLSALAGLAGGCGTVLNVCKGPAEPYGGVRNDFALLTTKDVIPLDPGSGTGALLILGIWAADVCVSGVADTLMLPYFYFGTPLMVRNSDVPSEFEPLMGKPQFTAGSHAPEAE